MTSHIRSVMSLNKKLTQKNQNVRNLNLKIHFTGKLDTDQHLNQD